MDLCNVISHVECFVFYVGTSGSMLFLLLLITFFVQSIYNYITIYFKVYMLQQCHRYSLLYM